MGKAWFGLDFRSPQQKEQEMALYERWAFPHGAAQRTAVRTVLDSLLARIHPSERIFCYLMVREAYWGTHAFGLPCAADEAAALHKARGMSPHLLESEAIALLTLMQVDEQMDEGLDYGAAIL